VLVRAPFTLVARAIFVRRLHTVVRVRASFASVARTVSCVVRVLCRACRASSTRCRIVSRVVNSPRLESLVIIILVIYLTAVSVAD
jgi:hypothetical protein